MNLATPLARFWPVDVAVSDDLRRAVAFLGWETPPAEIVRAGYGLGVVTLLVGLVGLALTPLPFGPVGWLAVGGLALGTVHVVHAGPRLVATARRTAALGSAPELVVLAVLRMRLAPAPERAAAFAARRGDGRLADSLRAHVEAATARGGTGFDSFGAEWNEWFPSLGRALGLVSTAGRLPESERDRTLDRALSVVLEGTERQMQAFAGSIHGPATALYAFGVLLPMALVSLLPAARAAGVPVTLPVVVVLYDLALPLLLVVASAWLLSRRPVAFPPPALSRSHPEVPDRRRLAVGIALVAALLGAGTSAVLLPGWAPPFAAVGLGIGAGLLVAYRPYDRVRRRIEAVEAGLTDALSLIGRQVTHGASVERAVREAAEEVDGEMGGVLADGMRRAERLDVGLERAFLGERGVLAGIPSSRVRGSFALVALAATEGRPAGGALRSVAAHVDDLQRVERDARADLRNVVETLRSTGMLFGPLVGGATVALAGHMSGEAGLVGGTVPQIPWLGFAIGLYVLALAVVLTVLSVGLERGLERSLIAAKLGTSLVVATATFLGGYLIASSVA
jgi:hypothetical protein